VRHWFDVSNQIVAPAGWSNTTWRGARQYAVPVRAVVEGDGGGAVPTLCVCQISNSTGCEVRLYRPSTDGRKGPNELDRPEIVKRCFDLWHEPNPFYTSSLFVEASQQHID
jgi:hypothetical protein